MALYIFQFGILQPVASIVNTQLPIAVFTLILVVISLINKFQIKKYVLLTFIFTSLYFLTNYFLFSNNVVIPLYFEFLLKSFSAVIIGSLITNGEKLYNAFLRIGIINFFCIFLYPFDLLDSMNYMRFGYAMIPSSIIFLFAIFMEKKFRFVYITLFIVSLLMTIMYGSRGTVLIIIFLVVIMLLFSRKISQILKGSIILVGFFFFGLIFSNNLVGKFFDFIYYNLGITNYSIMKFQRMFSGQFLEATSGRDRIYNITWDYIVNNPIYGYGVGFSRTISGSTTHNVFLQILSESGMIGLIFWMCILIFCLNKYLFIRKESDHLFLITTLLISVSLGRLMVSSDLWLRPEFWFCISLILNYKIKSNSSSNDSAKNKLNG